MNTDPEVQTPTTEIAVELAFDVAPAVEPQVASEAVSDIHSDSAAQLASGTGLELTAARRTARASQATSEVPRAVEQELARSASAAPDAQNIAAASALTESLHQQHGRNLRRYLLKRMRSVSDPQDAQDVQQEIYLELLQVPDVNLVRNPSAYLYGIALRVLGRALNKLQKQPLTLEAQELTELSDAITAATQSEGEETELDRERRWRRVLRKVPRTYREVVALRYRGNYSAEEIAAILSLTVNTVRTYCKFGTRALRDALQMEEDADRDRPPKPPIT